MEEKTHIGDLASTIKLLHNLSLHSVLTENQPSPPAPTTTVPVSFDRSYWVDFLVNEIAGATSVEDARLRASKVLGIMEGSSFQVAGVPTLKEVDKVKRVNRILKKAVCIQHQQVKKLEEDNEDLQGEAEARRGRQLRLVLALETGICLRLGTPQVLFPSIGCVLTASARTDVLRFWPECCTTTSASLLFSSSSLDKTFSPLHCIAL